MPTTLPGSEVYGSGDIFQYPVEEYAGLSEVLRLKQNSNSWREWATSPRVNALVRRKSSASCDASSPAKSGRCSDPSANDDKTSRWLLDRYRSNALAESVIGLYKNECVKPDGPFRCVDDLEFELATQFWVHWFNTNRPHPSIDYLTPIECQEQYFRQITPQPQPLLGEPALH